MHKLQKAFVKSVFRILIKIIKALSGKTFWLEKLLQEAMLKLIRKVVTRSNAKTY